MYNAVMQLPILTHMKWLWQSDTHPPSCLSVLCYYKGTIFLPNRRVHYLRSNYVI